MIDSKKTKNAHKNRQVKVFASLAENSASAKHPNAVQCLSSSLDTKQTHFETCVTMVTACLATSVVSMATATTGRSVPDVASSQGGVRLSNTFQQCLHKCIRLRSKVAPTDYYR